MMVRLSFAFTNYLITILWARYLIYSNKPCSWTHLGRNEVLLNDWGHMRPPKVQPPLGNLRENINMNTSANKIARCMTWLKIQQIWLGPDSFSGSAQDIWDVSIAKTVTPLLPYYRICNLGQERKPITLVSKWILCRGECQSDSRAQGSKWEDYFQKETKLIEYVILWKWGINLA